MKFALVESISIRKWKGSVKQLVLPDWLRENGQKHNGARLGLSLYPTSPLSLSCIAQIRKWQSKKVYWAENRCHSQAPGKHILYLYSTVTCIISFNFHSNLDWDISQPLPLQTTQSQVQEIKSKLKLQLQFKPKILKPRDSV